jgi:hypothetical protein
LTPAERDITSSRDVTSGPAAPLSVRQLLLLAGLLMLRGTVVMVPIDKQTDQVPTFHHSITPSPHHSITPSLHPPTP